MFKNLRKKKKGFTLIELIVVIAIIAVLAAIAIPKFGDASKKARTNAELANAKNIVNAATMAISEGDIIIPATAAAEAVAKVDSALLGKYLQSIPQTSDKKDFYIKVEMDGDIIVYNDDKGTSEVYPK